MRTLRVGLRGALVCATVLALAGAVGAAEVVVLKSADAAAWRPALDALRAGASGHTITEHDLAGNRATGQQILQGVKGRSVIVVALGPLAAQVCREVAPELPLVYAMVPDPAKAGLGGSPNTTGVAFQVPVKNQLAAFRMVNPRGVKIGVMYTADLQSLVDEAKEAASVVRLSIVERGIGSERDVPDALRGLLKDVDAIWIPPDAALLGETVRKFILEESLKKSTPVYAFSSALVAEGALVSNGANMGSIGSQLAELVGRIAAGESVASVGARVPAAELVINKKVADRLRLEIPADALRAAAKIH